ncbi:MAG: chemotaxis protein CheW [Oligoflexales bacterium]
MDNKKLGKTGSFDGSSDTIRVQVGLLDNLMNFIGELVLIRNQFTQVSSQRKSDDKVVALGQNLNAVTNELQNDVMKTRMQPIGNILSKLSRIVRDLSRDLKKEIDLSIQGAETELDKTLIEGIKDPLIHIVRNAVDHGIENPDVRVKKGKNEKGNISIKAFHEGGQVVVQVIDDGKGLDEKLIANKAVSKGLVSNDEIQNMTRKQIFNLIFNPGFSTAAKVSSISGRGVGMDVVKTNIEQINGTIELDSQEGHGSAILLKIPLTLAIVPAVIVQVKNEKYAIPQVKIQELVMVEDNEHGEMIEWLGGKPIYRLRGSILSLISLEHALGLCPKENPIHTKNIAVLTANNCSFGLVVDTIVDSTDIVVKPLSSFLKNASVYSGATIMGDGSVALVLDAVGLAEGEDIFSEQSQKFINNQVEDLSLKLNETVEEYLLVDLNVPGRYAIPLGFVHRLEEFDEDDLEYCGDNLVVNYGDDILPLISVLDYVDFNDINKSEKKSAKHSVAVVKHCNQFFGILVDSILDVIEIRGETEEGLTQSVGIVGNVIYKEQIIVCIDVYSIISEFIGLDSSDPNAEVLMLLPKNLSILLVEDSNSYRNHIQRTLKNFGFNVHSEKNGRLAHQYLANASNKDVDFVITDIEMPEMDGFELLENIRNSEKWGNIPVVAMTSRYTDDLIQRGKELGFSDFLKKFDESVLLNSMLKHLDKQKSAA